MREPFRGDRHLQCLNRSGGTATCNVVNRSGGRRMQRPELKKFEYF